ncbi:MAG: SEC-C metal-binding domain-containing protein [Clostridia bacterium]
MSYVPLYNYCPDLCTKEIKSLVLKINTYGVPKGEYILLESYCNDLNCDCRRVFIEVLSCKSDKSIATIAYGWEDENFYAKWYGITKNNNSYNLIIKSLKGPILNETSIQSKYAPAMLKIISNLLLKDIEYVNSLKKHYQLFKESVDKSKPKPKPYLKNKIGRNQPCPCGSGKKYKKCCIDNKIE